MMIEGIKAALDFEHDERRFRLVSFMTDGYIGNEVEILAAIQKRLGASRIFSFGVGQGPNRYLLDQMAKVGRGAVAYLSLNDNPLDVVDKFYERVSHPALTDISIDWGGLQVSDVYPYSVPDLFVGRPVVLTGRFDALQDTKIRIHGRAGGREHVIEVPVSGAGQESHPGIAAVWARKKIETLAMEMAGNSSSELADEIKNTALEFNLMSAYTAFVAVDSSRQTEGQYGVSVDVAVPVPEGVRYETTVPK